MTDLTVRSFRSDGRWYRAWQVACLHHTPAGIVTLGEPGTKVSNADGVTWIGQYRIRAFYWFDRPYNLLEVFCGDGALEELYVHIASPAALIGDELHYTDYELDVVQPAGGGIEIIDEDEFAAATIAYGYTPAFIAGCRVACARAFGLLERWRIGAPPEAALGTPDSS